MTDATTANELTLEDDCRGGDPYNTADAFRLRYLRALAAKRADDFVPPFLRSEKIIWQG